MASSTDRIEKQIFLRAPRSRVWTALTDAKQFGTWFQVELEGEFAAGAHVRGVIRTKSLGDFNVDMWVATIEPETRFAYRWHPFAIDKSVDYSKEPTTLVEFLLSEKDGGTALTVVESGFDALPPGRRPKAFEMNSEGWDIQCKRIEAYLDAK